MSCPECGSPAVAMVSRGNRFLKIDEYRCDPCGHGFMMKTSSGDRSSRRLKTGVGSAFSSLAARIVATVKT
jgi:transposase-like protein